MMKKINIGILGVQGDIEEHIASVKSAFHEITIDGIVSVIKYPEEIDSIHGLIIPGGEITSVQNSSNTSQKLLGSLDIEIERNAFGRQHESFQSEFPIPKFGLDKFTGVFIRAPRIRNIGSNVEILAKLNNEIVAVKQGNIIGTCFHPELSNTVIFHKYLIELVRETL